MRRAVPFFALWVTIACVRATAATEMTEVLSLIGLSSVEHGRTLLQSDICGAQEYFCGEKDMVLDTAYNAVAAGNCYNDSADTGEQCNTYAASAYRLLP